MAKRQISILWSARTTNRRMAGEPVWLVQQQRRHDMGSVRQVIDLDVGLFQLAGRGVQLAEFYRSHKYCGYCGMKCIRAKRMGDAVQPLP